MGAGMAATERITMTMRERDGLVIQPVAGGMLKRGRAEERVGLTTRQIRRLLARREPRSFGTRFAG